jgi:ribonucrease Y
MDVVLAALVALVIGAGGAVLVSRSRGSRPAELGARTDAGTPAPTGTTGTTGSTGTTAPTAPPATPSATTAAEPPRAQDRAAAEALLAEADAQAAAALSQAQADAAGLREAAAREADAIRREAEAAASAAAVEARAAIEADLRMQKADVERREQRLAEREERLDAEQRRVEQRDRELHEVEQEIARRKAELADVEEERRRVLERAAGLSAAEAKAELVAAVEHEAKREAMATVREIERQAQEQGEERARKIVTLAIQRVASDQTAESVVSVLHLPSDDMKGRIIGREGRNIRAFESTTGVNVIIDDTPEAVLLSSFDPVRRETARLTLEALVLDGRIHPQRIEEVYERSKAEVENLVVRAGEDAMLEVGITDMHPEIIKLLGRLKYRTSYGQNVLRHLVEAAHIAGVMAAEMRMNVPLLKRCTVLHDLGKALTHEVEGSHALIGAEIARKYGEDEEVAHAIEAHHGEVEQRTVEAVLTQAADAISGGRPGARRESLETYVKRLQRIEEIATGQPGVEKVFAMQAGREVRVMVLPEQVDDVQAQVLARDIAKQVEDELTYPGQIRITVVRESRAIEYAK